MQVWRTPFTSAEFAATAPVTGSFLAKVGNPDLVRGISDALSLRRTALSEAPSRQTWEDLIAAARRMVDAYHWLGNAECFELLPTVKELCTVSEQIIDEYEKVEAIRRRAAEALAGAETTQKELLRLRPEDDRQRRGLHGRPVGPAAAARCARHPARAALHGPPPRRRP
jgi:hypothetical protein